jgi:hypothetical protein
LKNVTTSLANEEEKKIVQEEAWQNKTN